MRYVNNNPDLLDVKRGFVKGNRGNMRRNAKNGVKGT
jgi:hypothetical protein